MKLRWRQIPDQPLLSELDVAVINYVELVGAPLDDNLDLEPYYVVLESFNPSMDQWELVPLVMEQQNDE